MLCYVTLCYVVLCYVLLCDVMYGVHIAHVWCPHSTCIVSIQYMCGVSTAHVWYPQSTCMVSTHVWCGHNTCVVFAKNIPHVKGTLGHIKITFSLFREQVGICLGTLWGWLGMGLGWFGENVQISFWKLRFPKCPGILSCNGVLKSIVSSLFPDRENAKIKTKRFYMQFVYLSLYIIIYIFPLKVGDPIPRG